MGWDGMGSGVDVKVVVHAHIIQPMRSGLDASPKHEMLSVGKRLLFECAHWRREDGECQVVRLWTRLVWYGAVYRRNAGVCGNGWVILSNYGDYMVSCCGI